MSRLARAAAVLFMVAGLTLVGPASIATAHAALLSSLPGAGDRVDVSPAELLLVFSERLDALGTGVELVDSTGRLLLSAPGTVDVADRRTLHIALPSLSDGLYTVNWRALSADDGHSSQGFFTFGVGDVEVTGPGSGGGSDVHSGHGLVQSAMETVSRFLSELGAMLALGTVLVAWLVARPTSAALTRSIGYWPSAALAATAAGAALLIPVAASSAGIGFVAYATATQPGALLVARIATGLVGAVVVFLLVRRGHPLALGAATTFGVLGVALLAASGHAASYGTVGPIVVSAIHIASAGAWLAGLLVLASAAWAWKRELTDQLRPMIPRFSAVALVSAVLFILTGLYLWWLLNRAVVDFSSDYATLLVAKLLLVALALAIGALSYLGIRATSLFGVERRIPLEAAIVLAVVGVTALLASGSPPGGVRPVEIREAVSSSPLHIDARLTLLPARPGPNRIEVTLLSHYSHDASVQLVLNRLDQANETTLTLAHGPNLGTYVADVPLPATSEWDASVRLIDSTGEQGRARFAFAMDADALSEGSALPIVDPLLLIAAILGLAAVLGVTLLLAGGGLPRADRYASRVTLVLGIAGAVLVVVAAVMFAPLP